jgi:hypothetical protein
LIRVKFDRCYIDDLQDYYRCNECIREPRDLSPATLVHPAAFCISKVATEIDSCEEPHAAAPQAEAAHGAIRQLLPLPAEGVHADLRSERVIVNGRTDGERSDAQPRMTTAEAGAIVARSIGRLRRLRATAGSVWRALAGENG